MTFAAYCVCIFNKCVHNGQPLPPIKIKDLTLAITTIYALIKVNRMDNALN